MKIALLIMLVHIQFVFVKTKCPKDCQCMNKTIGCQMCLSAYYQTYNLSTTDCNCLDKFQKFQGGGDLCCPLNCRKCYNRGCATCWPHATIFWNNSIKYFQCLCDQNYYPNGINCNCLSEIWPDQFYLNPQTNICYVCPYGCICSIYGCVNCVPESNRFVKASMNNLSVCECQYPYVENNGNCICPQKCICQGNTVVECSPQSHRIKSYQTWNCSKPYRQINGSCHCIEPYFEMDFFGQIKCVCKSKINYTMYHQINGICKPCGEGCTCDIRGCISCSAIFRYVENYQCTCNASTLQVNHDCACVNPYYRNGSECMCLDRLFPTLYYSYPDTVIQGDCYLCPVGCQCNQLGCVQCVDQALRYKAQRYSQSDTRIGKYICPCDGLSQQIDGICKCKSPWYYDPIRKYCVCPDVLYPALFYYDTSCYICPPLCKCDARGCYECHPSSLRIVQFTEYYQKFYCNCKQPFIDLDGITCKCQYQSTYNETIQSCQCRDPYRARILRNQVYPDCVCNAWDYPDKYFYDFTKLKCYKCPVGCKCSQLGCYDCQKYTMRYIIHQVIQNGSTIIQCPCYQNSFEIDGNCTSCPNNSYYNGENCTKCPLCKTCNFHGCLSCNENMTLVNHLCICNDNNFINLDGICACHFGFYSIVQEIKTNLCVKCPSYCFTCQSVSNAIQCLSCNTNNTHRQNVTDGYCPCQQGYNEHKQKRQYCCSMYCLDCDQKGCLSCPKYSLRTLVNGNCLCLEPYESVLVVQDQKLSPFDKKSSNQLYKITCGCPKSTYYRNQSCLPCPPSCQLCQYNHSTKSILCESCALNSNRNTSTDNCQCLKGYIETIPLLYYCYDKWCQNVEPVCQKCQSPRVLNTFNQCVCPLGSFDEQSICYPCFIKGCLKCNSRNTCQYCNQTENYFLINKICVEIKQLQYLFSQTLEQNFLLQIKLSFKIQSQNVSATIFKVQSLDFEESHQVSKDIISQDITIKEEISHELKVLTSEITQDNIFIVQMQNPKLLFENIVISFVFFHTNSSSHFQSVNIRINLLLPISIFQKYSNQQSFNVCRHIVILIIVIALLIAVSGNKQNQIMFYLQTITMIGYYLQEDYYKTTMTLNNFRFSLLNFKSGSIFNIFPQNYIESSPGNFKWTLIDSNIFRSTEILIVIQSMVLVLLVTLKFVDSLTVHIQKVSHLLLNFKRKSFRCLQFIFKNCMYPLIFFSINTLINADCIVYTSKHFKTISIFASVFILLVHTFTIVFMYNRGGLSNLNKLQLALGFICTLLFSFVIILSLKSRFVWVIFVIIIFIFKDLTYLVFKKKFSQNIYTYNQLIVKSVCSLEFVGTLIQVITPILISLNHQILIMVIVFATIIVQSVIQIFTIQRGRRQSLIEKRGMLSRKQRF